MYHRAGNPYDERAWSCCIGGAIGAVTVQAPPPLQRPSERPQVPGGSSMALSPLSLHPIYLTFPPAIQFLVFYYARSTSYYLQQHHQSTTRFHSPNTVKMVKAGKIASALLPRHCIKLCIIACANKRKEGSFLLLLRGLFHAIRRTLMASFNPS